MNKKVILMILDGWGKSPNPEVSAIEKANTPFIDSLYKKYPNSNLLTDGMNVGLPEGLAKINKAVKENTLKDEPILKNAFEYAKSNKKSVHFLGLVSDGGVHSHITHLKALIDAAESNGIEKAFVHAFTDGRDVDPKSGKAFLEDITKFCATKNTKLASVIGRYFAMDRDKRWERVKKAYDLLVNGVGTIADNISIAMEKSYADKKTDEFIEPMI